jgi:hypothetical protein
MSEKGKMNRSKVFHWGVNIAALLASLTFNACTKNIKVDIPDSAQQVVVDGSIETNTPPIVLLTKSQKFFGTTNLNDLSGYFIHGATVKVAASDGTQTDLIEYCLQDLNLPPDQKAIVLNALGFSGVDSVNQPNVCVYTVPDIINYFTSGTCSFMGKERIGYSLDIKSPPLYGGHDSIHVTSYTTIPAAILLDSLAIRPDKDARYADSLSAVYAYITVPDTFGNFIRYKTKRNSEPYYTPAGGSVYDDKMFIGLSLGLPLERGTAPGSKFDINTDTYFWKGDTVSVKWSNIDSKTYQFYYTLENDGGGSPFASPIKIQSNVNNGLGIWGGFATRYYSIIVPK